MPEFNVDAKVGTKYHMPWLKNISVKLSLLICLGLLAIRAHAAIISDLYDAKVPVENQSSSNQSKAIKQALKQVFVKVNGSPQILSHSQIVKQLAKASSLVRSYTYEKLDNQLYLIVNFDQDKIESAIRNAGFAVWDKRRPDTIVWLAIEDNQQQKVLISQENTPEYLQQIKQQTLARGIEVLLPLWDLTDLQKVDVYDIWGGFFQPIVEASERYDVTTTLSARIFLQDTSDLQSENKAPMWQIDWTLVDNSKVNAGQVLVTDPLLAMDAIVDVIATQLSEKYAISQLNRQLNPAKQQIVITNLDSISRYAMILKFLNSLSVVSNATLVSQQGTKATFELDLLGNEEDLLNTFSLDNKIKPVVDEMGRAVGNMEFVWVN